MADSSGPSPRRTGEIDELVAAKWKRMKILPSGLCSDTDFVRRVTLDLTGLPPTAENTRAFLADSRESRAKREALVDRLIGSPGLRRVLDEQMGRHAPGQSQVSRC